MKMKKKILFICRGNVFRSRFAEAFFKKLVRRNFYVKSAGILSMSKLNPLIKRDEKIILMERMIGLQNGIKITGKPKKISKKLLNWADIIIIVADDVPLNLFKIKKKITVWKIKDAKNKREIETTIKKIKGKVNNLIKNLEKK